MKNNKYLYIGIILGVFTIGYFVMVGNAAKEFGVDFETDLFNNTIKTIQTQAELYGEYKEGLFTDSNVAYVTIADLAAEDFVRENSEGVVLDPRDNSKTLNDIKIKITKTNDEIVAKVLV